MKKIIALLVCVVLFCCFANTATTYNEILLERVYEVNLQKEEIYTRCLHWFAETFRSSNAVIEYKNKEEGKIIGKGGTFYPVWVLLTDTPIDCEFTIIIDIKDNKYRLRFKDYLGLYDRGLVPLAEQGSGEFKKYIKRVNENIIEFSDDLHKRLSSPREDDF